MRKIEEYYICDRCKTKTSKEKLYDVYDYVYHYELCDVCKGNFDLYQCKVEKLKKEWEELEKEYKFGKYLPKEKGENVEK